jgi:Flp pilus assembly protein TadD
MLRHPVLVLVLLAAAIASAREKPDNWLEVRSPHFIVVSDSSEKQARRVADQLERMRSVFHAAFPRMQVDPPSPIIILAVKDEKRFRALEPELYLGKGKLALSGLFQSGPEKNYVLLRLDAQGEHPYSVIYHEYTHLLSSKAAEWLPLWLSEGLAEFYENTEIREKEVSLGEASTLNIGLLRENRILPLQTLFAVTHTSPYYNEQNKGTIFYAEAWALTHYLMVSDRKENTHRLADYLALVSQRVDATTAAVRAFGDLKQLQATLQDYVRQGSFNYFRMPVSTEVDEEAFKIRSLSLAQADAVRADFLVYDGRYQDARALLEDVLREDPNNVSAYESMGCLEFRQGHVQEARQWYEQAVKLDSHSYLAQYYFAVMAMQGKLDTETATQVESSLQAAIKLNPSFAPAYDRLAVFYGMRHEHLEEAHTLELNAVQLDPGNLAYRLNTGMTLLAMGRADDAVTVIRNAMNLAKSPEDLANARALLQSAEQYQAARRQEEPQAREAEEKPRRTDSEPQPPRREAPGSDQQAEPPPPVLRHRDETPKGPRRVVEGKIEDVQCSQPAIMDLKVKGSNRTVALHADNYYKVSFTAANFTPHGELHPCEDIEGLRARIEFVASTDHASPGQIVSIELSK